MSLSRVAPNPKDPTANAAISDDMMAFLDEEGETYQEELKPPPPEDMHREKQIAAQQKTLKKRQRRQSVTLRNDIMDILDDTCYKIESANLTDRPGGIFKGLEFSQETGLASVPLAAMNSFQVSELWRASARHLLALDEKKEGTKGRRAGLDEFHAHRNMTMSELTPRLCQCLFKDTVEVQWDLHYGAYNRQCFEKQENQDGFAFIAPHSPVGAGAFLSDPNARKNINRPDSKGVPYAGVSNYHAESVCRIHPRSSELPTADVTLLGNHVGLEQAFWLHQMGVAMTRDLPSDGGSKKKNRRSSVGAMKQLFVSTGSKEKIEVKTHTEPTHADLQSSPGETTCRFYSSQDEVEPMSFSADVAQTQNHVNYINNWSKVDNGVVFPGAYFDGGKERQFQNSVRHPGTKVNPIRPAVLIALDGHGSGGKLGAARAANTFAEALTTALSTISYLATSTSATHLLPLDQVHSIINASARQGEDMKTGHETLLPGEFVFSKMGEQQPPLSDSFCTCRTDHQILKESYAATAKPKVLRKLNPDQPYDSKILPEDKELPKSGQLPMVVALKQKILEASRQLTLNALSVAFRTAHSRLLQENDHITRDFGSTACAMVLAGRYLYSAWVGDSPGILVAIKGNQIGVIRLTREHCLKNPHEYKRVQEFTGPENLKEKDSNRKARRNSTGKILATEMAGDRLIPGYRHYEDARQQGLSINMARALGHNQLTYCALSPQPEFAVVDLLHCMPRMRWFNGDRSLGLDQNYARQYNRPFHNANTMSSVAMGKDATDEAADIFHTKPGASVTDTAQPPPACEHSSLPSSTLISAFEDVEFYAAAYSDGLGDCFSPPHVASLIYEHRKKDCHEITKIITEQAEYFRRNNRIHADNCVMTIARLRVDAFIPVVSSSKESSNPIPIPQ